MPNKSTTKSNSNKELVFLVSILFVLFSIYIVFINLQMFSINKSFSNKSKDVVLGESIVESEEEYWSKYLESNPHYLPGYLELYKIESKNGNVEHAEDLKEVIFKLNPNLNLK
jgi:hypothetical protein